MAQYFPGRLIRFLLPLHVFSSEHGSNDRAFLSSVHVAAGFIVSSCVNIQSLSASCRQGKPDVKQLCAPPVSNLISHIGVFFSFADELVERTGLRYSFVV